MCESIEYDRTHFHRTGCIQRDCNKCGVHLLTDNVRHLAGYHRVKNIDWYRWDTIKADNKSKKTLSSVTGSVDFSVRALEEDMKGLICLQHIGNIASISKFREIFLLV